MASNPVAELIATVPLFSSLNAKQCRELSRYCFEITLEPGTEVVRQGAVGVDCYVILSGSADVTRNSIQIAGLSAGDMIGEMASLDFQPRSATVTATTALHTLQISARDLSTAIDTIPGLARVLMIALAKRVRSLDAQLLAS
jgi:CRP-like cAMP-binding protein